MRLKTNNIESTTVDGAAKEIEENHMDFVQQVCEEKGWAVADAIEAIATHIVMTDTDFIISKYMEIFTEENTNGYTQNQLDELNLRLEKEIENLDENDFNYEYENDLKNIPDRIRAKYDTESTRYHIDATYEIDYLDGSDKVGGCRTEDGYKNVFDVNNTYCLEVENILNNDNGVVKFSI